MTGATPRRHSGRVLLALNLVERLTQHRSTTSCGAVLRLGDEHVFRNLRIRNPERPARTKTKRDGEPYEQPEAFE